MTATSPRQRRPFNRDVDGGLIDTQNWDVLPPHQGQCRDYRWWIGRKLGQWVLEVRDDDNDVVMNSLVEGDEIEFNSGLVELRGQVTDAKTIILSRYWRTDTRGEYEWKIRRTRRKWECVLSKSGVIERDIPIGTDHPPPYELSNEQMERLMGDIDDDIRKMYWWDWGRIVFELIMMTIVLVFLFVLICFVVLTSVKALFALLTQGAHAIYEFAIK